MCTNARVTHLEALDSNVLLVRETKTNDVEHGGCWIKICITQIALIKPTEDVQQFVEKR